MPITQHRMLQLIAACDAFHQGLLQAKKNILDEITFVKSGQYSAEHGLENLAMLNNPETLTLHYIESITTLAVEKEHFRSSVGRNNASAKWQRKRRRERAEAEGRVLQTRDERKPLHIRQEIPSILREVDRSVQPPMQLPSQPQLPNKVEEELSQHHTFPDETESESMDDASEASLFPSEGDARAGEDEISIDDINLYFDPSRVSPDLMVEVEQALRESRVRRGEPAVQVRPSLQEQEENKS